MGIEFQMLQQARKLAQQTATEQGEKDQQTAKKVKLEEQTKQLESELLAEKPWAMRGETHSQRTDY